MDKPIYLGCDDSGYAAKRCLLERLEQLGYACVDCGGGEEPSRYPWYAAKAASAVSEGRADRAILICGSGVGMCIAANKYPNVRAALVTDVYTARLTRRHNDANILCLGGELLGPWQIAAIAEAWLAAAYDGGHHEPSLALLREIEKTNLSGARWNPEQQPYPPFDWDPAQEI